MPTAHIAALLTCHNRRDKTMACLQSLRDQIDLSELGIKLQVFLVDDGCTDGTAAAALEIWPKATIITGDGKLFWCGGMRKAWQAASATDPDFYLLLNDDTVLFPDAIRSLLGICPTPETETIAVGAICDPESGDWTYGGLQSDEPFKNHADTPRLCRTMNANCAFVSRAVFHKIGMFFQGYRHAMGDMDYGLLATKKEIIVVETPSFVGACQRNIISGTWRDTSLSRLQRFKKLLSPKGLPPNDWFCYCRRNCGRQWLRYWLSPYFRIMMGK